MPRTPPEARSLPFPRFRAVAALGLIVAALASLAAGAGLLTRSGPGPHEHISIRGTAVAIHGRGIYRDMSAEVAPQGIAQDAVTLGIGVPLLLGALAAARRGGLRARLVLAGTLMYFVVTYGFYLAMAMYNALFPAYAALLGTSAFGFGLTMAALPAAEVAAAHAAGAPARAAGGFLVGFAAAIATLWLSIVIPPLIDGTIVPAAVEHYTTLIVQGFDLALLLPLAIAVGVDWWRGGAFGKLAGPVYLVFLAILTTALTAKVIATGLLGHPIFPAVALIPAGNLAAAALAIRVLRGIRDEPPTDPDSASTIRPG